MNFVLCGAGASDAGALPLQFFREFLCTSAVAKLAP